MKIMEIMTYNPTQRIAYPVWGCLHIDNLIRLSFMYYDASSVLYACFEARNIFEQIDYLLALTSVPLEQEEECKNRAKKLSGGIRAHTNHYRTFIERYIEAYADLCQEVGLSIPEGKYEINASHSYREKLNNYLHLYDKVESDFAWGSPFIIEGIEICNEILRYISKTGIVRDFGILQLGYLLNQAEGASTSFEDFKHGNIDKREFIQKLIENNWIMSFKLDLQNYFRDVNL